MQYLSIDIDIVLESCCFRGNAHYGLCSLSLQNLFKCYCIFLTRNTFFFLEQSLMYDIRNSVHGYLLCTVDNLVKTVLTCKSHKIENNGNDFEFPIFRHSGCYIRNCFVLQLLMLKKKVSKLLVTVSAMSCGVHR